MVGGVKFKPARGSRPSATKPAPVRHSVRHSKAIRQSTMQKISSNEEEEAELKDVYKRANAESDDDRDSDKSDWEPESKHSGGSKKRSSQFSNASDYDEERKESGETARSLSNEEIESSFEENESEEESDKQVRQSIRDNPSPKSRNDEKKSMAKRRELFEVVASQQLEQPSWVYQYRGYHSEPCIPLPFESKFTLKKQKRDKHKKNEKKIKEKCLSLEDLHLSRNEYPDLVTGVLSEVQLRQYAINDTMTAAWKAVFELEKKRFSFFDELFAQGYVVDSMEVPRSGHQEPVDYFIEAEEHDFRDKIDYGRVVFKTKHMYTGNFVDWYFQGAGKYVWVDGTVYQGDFKHGLMNGKGTIRWRDGSLYEGEFRAGTRAGWGVYSTAEGFTYAGDWLNGVPHGQGKMWYDPGTDDGDYYDGEWADGLQNGKGTRQYSNGDRYIGNWTQGQRSGNGTMIWLNERQVYKGEWVDGAPHGKGKHIWYLERTGSNAFPTRHVYYGDWFEGKRHGIGKMIYPCGSIYEGRWKNGQRHGKGVFLNPAGDIIMGLFRAGSIVGGADVPLHAPTYEYDFGGLVEWLTVKFNLNTENELIEEENLSDITVRFLSQLRKLYKRAGNFGQTWGNSGLYPYWMKRSHPRHEHHIPNHDELEEALHMRGKTMKPLAPDGVNPVTRFGLWLLIKDCAGLNNDVTLGYYDKIFSETPSISFQTRHNPFEPVYLWQFLQCLVIVAVAVNMEIPEKKSRLRFSKPDISHRSHDSHVRSKNKHQTPETNDGEIHQTTDTSDAERHMTPDTNDAERHHTSETNNKMGVQQLEETPKHRATTNKDTGHHHLEETPGHHTTDTNHSKRHHDTKHRTTTTHKDQKTQDTGHHQHKETPGPQAPLNNNIQNHQDNGHRHHSVSESPPVSLHDNVPESLHDLDNQGSTSTAPRKQTIKATITNSELGLLKTPENMQFLVNQKSSKINPNDGSTIRSTSTAQDHSSVEPTSPPKTWDEVDLPHENCFIGWNISEGCKETVRKRSSEMFKVPNNNPKVHTEGYYENDSDDDDVLGEYTPWHKRLRNFKMSISEAFETFLMDKLVPCLDREPGVNLPEVPSPLPPLPDLYDSFKDLQNRDWVTATEFMQSALPHLVNPNPKDAIYWHRCSEVLSKDINLDALIALSKEKGLHDGRNDSRENYDIISVGSDYLGSNSDLKLATAKVASSDGKCMKKGPGDVKVTRTAGESITDFVTDPLPFSEQDLTSEPFLWDDEPKCRRVEKHHHHYHNLNTHDILNVLRFLYPNLVGHNFETNLNFDMIFCDWLWGVCLCAKISADREFRSAMKYEKDERSHHHTNNRTHHPQNAVHGVFDNHAKRIRKDHLTAAHFGKQNQQYQSGATSSSITVISASTTEASGINASQTNVSRKTLQAQMEKTI